MGISYLLFRYKMLEESMKNEGLSDDQVSIVICAFL